MTTIHAFAEPNADGSVQAIDIKVDPIVLDAIAKSTTDGEFDPEKFFLETTGFTKDQIEAQFEKVQNVDHWKNPINAVVLKTDLLLTIQAIVFYHANHNFDVIDVDEKNCRITTTGYAA